MAFSNPFVVFHRKRTPREVLGTRKNYHLTWEKQELPDAGAMQYSWETLGLPPYAVFGFGNINVQKPLRATSPGSYIFQSVGIVGNPPTSIVQGQLITQPLMDPNQATALGLVIPGSLTNAPNQISNAGPTLSP